MEIAVFGSILLVLMIPFAYLLSKPFYTVQGRILVAPAVSTFIVQNEETPITGYYNAYVRTHVSRLKQRDVFEKALTKLEPELKSQYIPKAASLSFAASMLMNKMEIDHLSGTHLISLSITGESPDGLAEVINNIADVYMEEIQKEMETKDYRRLMYLQHEKEKIEEDIISQNRLLQEIAKEAGTFSFESENNIFNTQFEVLEEEYVRAYSDRVLKENTLASLISLGSYRQKVSVTPLVEEFVNQSSASSQLGSSTYQELIKLNSALAEYPPSHPGRAKIESKIQALEENLKQFEINEKKKAENFIVEKRKLDLNERIMNARADYEAAKRAEEDIRSKRDEILAKRSGISQKLISGKQIGDKVEHLRSILNRIEDRISELNLESKAPGRLQIESYAKRPQMPSGSNLKKILMIFLLLSYGSILMICVIYDIFDKRVRDRKNVFNALGSHPSWPVSNYKFTGTSDIPFSRVTIDDSSNVVAKAIQSLAVRIDKERKEHDARCVVFTGIDRKCGTTEILVNTAYAITKLCKNVIVIDAHFDQPNIENLLSTVTDKPGIIDFLLGRASIKECIVHDDERGLDFILPGRKPTSEDLGLLDLSIIPHMIRELKQRYALILIDSAPVLTSDITEYFILQSDATIAVIQGDKTKYDHLYLAGDILFRLKVPAIGAVLNWGAPRNLNKGQILVSKILWPCEKLLAKITGTDLKFVRYFIEEPEPQAVLGVPPEEEDSSLNDTG